MAPAGHARADRAEGGGGPMKRVREYVARWEALLLVFLIGTFVFGAGVSRYFWTASNISIATASFMPDRKSTRLNSSHTVISYAVFCLKKKKSQTNAGCGNSHPDSH